MAAGGAEGNAASAFPAGSTGGPLGGDPTCVPAAMVHAPFAGATAEGDAALHALLAACDAPDVLKQLNERGQRGSRMALRVVWPTFKAGERQSARARASGTSGTARGYSVFECRLVDVRGDSCLFRAYVDGDRDAQTVKKRGDELMEKYFHGSAWHVSAITGLSALRTTGASGCSVQYVLTWRSQAPQAPARFAALQKQSPLERALPGAPLPAGGLADLECLRERRLVDLCLLLVEAGEAKVRAGGTVVDATFVDEQGCRVTMGMWREQGDVVAQHVGQVLYAYDVLADPGAAAQASALERLTTLQSTRLYVPKRGELTGGALRLLDAGAPTSGLRDLVPAFQARSAYNFHAAGAVETTAAVLAACLPGANVQRLDLQDHELFEVPGALVLPDRQGPEASARTNDGKRLFFPAQLVDLSGACPVRVAEQPALLLANVQSPEEFEEQLHDGTLQLSRARLRVRREAREAVVYLTVGAAAPSLVVDVPAALPHLSGLGALPARLADVAQCKFGGLQVQLRDGAGSRVLPVAHAVIAVRGTCRAESTVHEGNAAARSRRVADALVGSAQPQPVDLLALVPLALTGAFCVNKDETALVVVSEALLDSAGKVSQLMATHVWKLPGGEEGKRLLASFGEELGRAQALACGALAASRKRPRQAGTAQEAAALLLPSGHRVCAAMEP